MLELEKQKHNEPRFDELGRMLSDLKDFLNEDANPKDKLWRENLEIILDFQDPDGSFKLFDSYDIPSDARADFCYLPTYVCTAILMKAFLTDSSFSAKTALLEGLESSCARNLRGHGYEALKGQITALNIFMKAGLREFMDIHSDFCPQFSEMIEKTIGQYAEMESQGKFLGPWGESYEDEIRAVNEYFRKRNVFVYGTLMKGQTNHSYLKNSKCCGSATVEGYDMYDCGWYPAIVDGDSLIVGELYEVSADDMPSIDMLEGEGSLYAKRCEMVNIEGRTVQAFVYVYLDDLTGLERIPAWKREYVWYVSYGSNMLRERFMCYLKGGSFEKSRPHPPCGDMTPPVAVRSIELPYSMYFANTSASWQNGGVSFLDVSKRGKSLAVAYLITKEQFEHVVLCENAGRAQNRDCGWYEDTIDLGMMDGFEVRTITNLDIRKSNEPSGPYWDTLVRGIRQNWPEMSDVEIEDYLKGCLRFQ